MMKKMLPLALGLIVVSLAVFPNLAWGFWSMLKVVMFPAYVLAAMLLVMMLRMFTPQRKPDEPVVLTLRKVRARLRMDNVALHPVAARRRLPAAR